MRVLRDVMLGTLGAPYFGHEFCSRVAFGANVLHDIGGLLRRTALGQRLAQERQRECRRLFHVECKFQRAVLDSNRCMGQIIVCHMV